MEHDSPDASATGHPIAEPESVQLVPEENHAPPAMLQFAKTIIHEHIYFSSYVNKFLH